MRGDLGIALCSLGSPVPLGGRQREASFFIWFEGTGQSTSQPRERELGLLTAVGSSQPLVDTESCPCGAEAEAPGGWRGGPGRLPMAPHTARLRGGAGRDYASRW